MSRITKGYMMGGGDIRMFIMVFAVFFLIYLAFIGVMEVKKLIIHVFTKIRDKKDMKE